MDLIGPLAVAAFLFLLMFPIAKEFLTLTGEKDHGSWLMFSSFLYLVIFSGFLLELHGPTNVLLTLLYCMSWAGFVFLVLSGATRSTVIRFTGMAFIVFGLSMLAGLSWSMSAVSATLYVIILSLSSEVLQKRIFRRLGLWENRLLSIISCGLLSIAAGGYIFALSPRHSYLLGLGLAMSTILGKETLRLFKNQVRMSTSPLLERGCGALVSGPMVFMLIRLFA